MKAIAKRHPTRVSIAGLGEIGTEVACRLAAGVSGMELVAVSARDSDKATERLGVLGMTVPVVPLDELEPLSDLVIECLPRELLPLIADPVLRAGKEIVILSVGMLLERPDLIDLAREHGGRISVPTGALVGLDAVAAAALGNIESVKLTTRKPVKGLVGAPYLEEKGIQIEHIDEPVRIFSGTAAEAVNGFPANLNVSAALALAGVGPQRTLVEIWVDPTVTKNTHTVELHSDVADLTMTIENVPTDNPRTGRITALSVISLLQRRGSVLSVGS